MTPLELAAILITAATSLKDEGMELEIDPSANFMDLATLVAIAYAENEQGENIGTGQSILKDEEVYDPYDDVKESEFDDFDKYLICQKQVMGN